MAGGAPAALRAALPRPPPQTPRGAGAAGPPARSPALRPASPRDPLHKAPEQRASRGRDGVCPQTPERRHQQRLATAAELQKTTHDTCCRRASYTRNNCLSQSFNHQGCYEKLTFLPLD